MSSVCGGVVVRRSLITMTLRLPPIPQIANIHQFGRQLTCFTHISIHTLNVVSSLSLSSFALHHHIQSCVLYVFSTRNGSIFAAIDFGVEIHLDLPISQTISHCNLNRFVAQLFATRRLHWAVLTKQIKNGTCFSLDI